MIDPASQFHAHRPLKLHDHHRLPLIAFSIWSSFQDHMPRLERRKTRPYFFICWLAEGSILAVSGETRHRLHANQAVILPQGVLTGFESTGPHHRYQLKVAGSCLAEILSGLDIPVDRVIDAGPPPATTMRRLQQTLLDVRAGADIAASQLTYELLAALAPDGRPAARDDFVARAIQRIQEHWQDPSLNINSLAAMLQVNRSSLSQRFKSETGTSPGQYLRQYRLRQAVAMLESSSLSIGDIAQRCGFSGNAQFCRLVQRQLQQSPSEIRAGA